VSVRARMCVCMCTCMYVCVWTCARGERGGRLRRAASRNLPWAAFRT